LRKYNFRQDVFLLHRVGYSLQGISTTLFDDRQWHAIGSFDASRQLDNIRNIRLYMSCFRIVPVYRSIQGRPRQPCPDAPNNRNWRHHGVCLKPVAYGIFRNKTEKQNTETALNSFRLVSASLAYYLRVKNMIIMLTKDWNCFSRVFFRV